MVSNQKSHHKMVKKKSITTIIATSNNGCGFMICSYFKAFSFSFHICFKHYDNFDYETLKFSQRVSIK